MVGNPVSVVVSRPHGILDTAEIGLGFFDVLEEVTSSILCGSWIISTVC